MIRILLSATVFLLPIQLFSQEKAVIKYYDSAWSQTPKESAFYSAEFNKEGNLYKCTAYWVNSKKLNAVGFFADTSLAQPRNLLINYYENGQMQDSTWYNGNSQPKFAYHYYQNGKLLARHFNDPKTNKEITEGFDEQGMLITDFIYAREAEFPQGNTAWSRFIAKNLNTQVPIKNGAPYGNYQVMILFVIDKNGEVSIIKPETNNGYGMEEEAIRVIRNSPRWNPLISLGEAKNAYRRQPITFVVSAK
jgi:antitoxin component YwqK of YwqJK toxin-antitoxin module